MWFASGHSWVLIHEPVACTDSILPAMMVAIQGKWSASGHGRVLIHETVACTHSIMPAMMVAIQGKWSASGHGRVLIHETVACTHSIMPAMMVAIQGKWSASGHGRVMIHACHDGCHTRQVICKWAWPSHDSCLPWWLPYKANWRHNYHMQWALALPKTHTHKQHNTHVCVHTHTHTHTDPTTTTATTQAKWKKKAQTQWFQYPPPTPPTKLCCGGMGVYVCMNIYVCVRGGGVGRGYKNIPLSSLTLIGRKRMASVSRLARYRDMLLCSPGRRVLMLRYVSMAMSCTFSGVAKGWVRRMTLGVPSSLVIATTTPAYRPQDMKSKTFSPLASRTGKYYLLHFHCALTLKTGHCHWNQCESVWLDEGCHCTGFQRSYWKGIQVKRR